MNLHQRRWIGGATWALGAVVAVGWGTARNVGVQAPGVGFAPPVQVAALEPGRLAGLRVSLHQEVHAGDVVASIDPSLVLAEREVAEATLLAIQERLGIDVATESRRFAESAEGTRLARAQLLASIREDEATVRTLQERLAIEEDLVAGGAASGLLADDARWQLEVVRARLDASRAALALADAAAANAEHRNAEAPGRNDWETVAAARAVELLDERLAYYELTAGIDGHVTAVWAAPGSMVTPGVPILEIRAVETREVVAYLPFAAADGVAPGDVAQVVRATGESLPGRLVSVGGSPQAMPLPLWPYPNYPQFGVPVRIELQDGRVAPDEPVTVHL